MGTRSKEFHGRSLLMGLAILLMAAHSPGSQARGIAQEPPSSASSTVALSPGAGRPKAVVSVDHLRVQLRPLEKTELQTELQVWMDLLKAKVREVSEIELKILTLEEGNAKDSLKEDLLAQRTEETAIIERAQLVVDALEAKGGDTQESRQFINAVSDIGEISDRTSFRAAIIAEVVSWISRDNGGKLWAKRFLAAAFILFVAWLISRFAGRVTAKALARHPRASALLENFARRTTGGIVFVVGLLMALSALGVPVGPLMAALGAGGFIVGFALQETLASFASGLMIMVYRPFDVNDYVAITGVEGTVREMSLVSTTLLTLDNKVVVIPNKKAWGDTIINFTGREIRRVDLVFGIGYEDDIRHATDVLREVATNHELVLSNPAVMVHVDELADSSVNLFCRPWVKTGDYWTVLWDLTRQIKERFDAEGINIPYPQRDIHTHSEPVPT